MSCRLPSSNVSHSSTCMVSKNVGWPQIIRCFIVSYAQAATKPSHIVALLRQEIVHSAARAAQIATTMHIIEHDCYTNHLGHELLCVPPSPSRKGRLFDSLQYFVETHIRLEAECSCEVAIAQSSADGVIVKPPAPLICGVVQCSHIMPRLGSGAPVQNGGPEQILPVTELKLLWWHRIIVKQAAQATSGPPLQVHTQNLRGSEDGRVLSG